MKRNRVNKSSPENNVSAFVETPPSVVMAADIKVAPAAKRSVRVLLTTKEVSERCSLPKSSLYALIAAGRFPRPQKISSRSVRFLASDVDEWAAQRFPSLRHP